MTIFTAFDDVQMMSDIAFTSAEHVALLVEILQTCPSEDTHLRHAARVALRNALRDTRDGWAAAEKAAEEKRLKAQFAAMETALNYAQTQQAWLTSQIATL